MNPLLQRLKPYPFERLAALTREIEPNPAFSPISLGLGEPKHATPALVRDALTAALDGLSRYPATAGEPALREACAGWVQRRYGVTLNPRTEVLPVNGTREALFSLAQTLIDPTRPGAAVLCPNPFYQIYEGAALLGAADVVFANSDPQRNFAPDWRQVSAANWARIQLVYVCSPGNPTGAVMPLAEWQTLFELSDRHGFTIASDECYSEIYFGAEDANAAPLGGLQAALALGRDFKRLVMLTSLSKRSNVPGMRSGFVAGDAGIIKNFLLYRTYHGSAMSPAIQAASIAAWNDEEHVKANPALYRAKFAQVTPLLASVLDVKLPDAGFYLWAAVPGSDDVGFALDLFAQYNVSVLPGSLLARDAYGINPGRGRIRMALVAGVDACAEAARRIVSFTQSRS